MAAQAVDQPPERGIASREVRLTYPGRWRTSAAAWRFARDNGLDTAGVDVVAVGDAWNIVIDSYRAAMLLPWLRQQFPSVLWAVGWTPQP